MKDMGVDELKAGILQFVEIGERQSVMQLMQEYLNRGDFTLDTKTGPVFWSQVRTACLIDPATRTGNVAAMKAFFETLEARGPEDKVVKWIKDPHAREGNAPVVEEWEPGLT